MEINQDDVNFLPCGRSVTLKEMFGFVNLSSTVVYISRLLIVGFNFVFRW